MTRSAQWLDIRLNRAFYRPGEPVQLTVWISSQPDAPLRSGAVPARLSAVIRHLADPIGQVQQAVTLTGGEQPIALTWSPPLASPRGYGIDLRLESEDGVPLAAASTAFDVLDRWTQMPRYGFLTDFSPGRSDTTETMDALTRYHINGLQFYDWMYRHEQFLTDQEPYRDLLGRELSRASVEALIAAAHARGIAAMPYTAVYGASVAFYREHPDWALRRQDGQPVLFGDDFLVIMDPRPNSPWTRHLLDQFEQVLRQTAFDGIHLDQYGDPKVGYDSSGLEFPLDGALAEFINATRARVDSLRPEAAVVFNAVNNWPVELVAPAAQDLVYIEVWPPHTGFDDLHRLIVEAQTLGDGKPVVLAAYIDPSLEHNVRLIDVVVFASGGAHIELGERDGMLADAYFPRYGTMSSELAEAVRRYYDFAVRYQEAIGPHTRDPARSDLRYIAIEGISTAWLKPEGGRWAGNQVWAIVREGEGLTAISLVNLLGLETPEWARRLESPPIALGPAAVHIGVDRAISRIWLAIPDSNDPSPQPVSFRRGRGADGEIITLQVPFLKYWDLLVIEWAE